MEKAFLCREALIALGAIHANFPEISASWPQDLAASVESSEPPTCHCPSCSPKPALVPIHWQENVLKDLERDVKIGVLEKVGSLGFNPSVLRYCTSPENPSICDYLMSDSAHVDSPPSIPILCAVLLHPPAA
ncbi:hypothetical protein RRG08_004431 [Elysia crispata]|uniref:Uncharacterized protein n=1 Tax=Elysia crispata TaxID=231223 RepID=A0AAE1DWX5_9GAST|nr:hypothetical protein RRG08_004431 [Elysia crispata]